MFSILALELDGPIIRAAVLKQTVRGIRVIECLESSRPSEGESLTAEELEMLISRIDKCPRSLVVVTPQVEMVEITMEAKRVEKMKPYQIREAVRWEAEPYSTLPAAECLSGFEIGHLMEKNETGVWVTMLPQEDYQELKRVTAEAGLRLKRVYPPDLCFSEAAAHWNTELEQIAVNIGHESIRFALMLNGESIAYRMVPAGIEAIQGYLDGDRVDKNMVDAVRDVLAAWDGRHKVIVTSGCGALDRMVNGFFRREFGVKVDPLHIPAEISENAAVFANAVGAGLRELYFGTSWKTPGITDAVDMAKLIRESIHIYPLVAAAVVIAFFFGHYFWINHQINIVEQETIVLTRQRDHLKTLDEEQKKLEKERNLLSTKFDFLTNDADAALNEKQILFNTLGACAPWDLQLKEVKSAQVDTKGKKTKGAAATASNLWDISGTSGSTASIHNYVAAIHKKDWCESIQLVSIKLSSSKTRTDEEIEPSSSYDFILKLKVKNS
ncbi:MAG: hypothetical protein RQM95_11290 [Syntrophaceticus schinkii]